jgi:hypothetical protein
MADQFEGVKSAADTAKQIIALSTGVIALTVTFLEKLVSTGVGGHIPIPWALKVSWILYGLSLLFGLFTLMAITGVTNEAVTTGATPDAMRKSIVGPAVLMVISFLAAIAFTIWTGFVLFG